MFAYSTRWRRNHLAAKRRQPALEMHAIRAGAAEGASVRRRTDKNTRALTTTVDRTEGRDTTTHDNTLSTEEFEERLAYECRQPSVDPDDPPPCLPLNSARYRGDYFEPDTDADFPDDLDDELN